MTEETPELCDPCAPLGSDPCKIINNCPYRMIDLQKGCDRKGAVAVGWAQGRQEMAEEALRRYLDDVGKP